MIRLLRALTLTTILGLGLASTSAFGQAAAPAEAGTEEGGGGAGPLPGYIATGCLAGAAMFVLCKSARR